MTAIIEFAPDGTGQCLHTDIIPLQEIGRLTVRRASEVVFDEANQEWCVFREGGSIIPLFRSPSRQLCLDWERDNFQLLV